MEASTALLRFVMRGPGLVKSISHELRSCNLESACSSPISTSIYPATSSPSIRPQSVAPAACCSSTAQLANIKIETSPISLKSSNLATSSFSTTHVCYPHAFSRHVRASLRSTTRQRRAASLVRRPLLAPRRRFVTTLHDAAVRQGFQNLRLAVIEKTLAYNADAHFISRREIASRAFNSEKRLGQQRIALGRFGKFFAQRL